MMEEAFTPWNLSQVTPVWGILMIIGQFLLGLSAGMYIVSSLSTLFGLEKYKPVTKISAQAALVFAALGALVFIIELGRPERFYTILYRANPTSAFAYGTWIITIYSLVALAYNWMLYRGVEKNLKAVGAAGLFFAVLIPLYSGFDLGVVQAHALWFTGVQPIFYFAGALISGFALVLLVNIARYKNEELAKSASNILVWVLAANLVIMFASLVSLLTGQPEARAAAMILLSSSASILGVFLLGAVVPLAVLVHPATRNSSPAIALASVLAIAGVFLARYVTITIGQGFPIILS